MAYTVDVEQGASYVSAALTGEITIFDLEGIRDDSSRAMQDHGLTRLLLDASRSTPTQSVADDFDFTSELKAHFPRNVRHAIIHRPEAAAHMKFVEDVARNRGLNLRVFFDRAAALDWLLEG